jgi:hypothetical protein
MPIAAGAGRISAAVASASKAVTCAMLSSASAPARAPDPAAPLRPQRLRQHRRRRFAARREQDAGVSRRHAGRSPLEQPQRRSIPPAARSPAFTAGLRDADRLGRRAKPA